MDLLLNLKDYETAARSKLPLGVYDYYARGAADDITLRENETAWTQIRLSPRVLVDVSACDLTTTILGQKVALPIMTAPCALNCMAHPEGELAVARATKAMGVIQVVSTGASRTIEEVAAASDGLRWFQVYCLRDRRITRALVERAEAAGYRALCLTVDAPFDGVREHNFRNDFRPPPPGVEQANLLPYMGAAERGSSWHDPSITWEIIAWLRSLSRLPIVLKGIMAPADARLAVEHGIEGIIVSNHGGRQLDTVLPTGAALREIVDAAAGRTEVYVDGGIRRGSDILKALALGARAVLIGRPYLWALTVEGEAGVLRVLQILRDELGTNMALAGSARVADIGRALIA